MTEESKTLSNKMKSNLTLFILGTVLTLAVLGGIAYFAMRTSPSESLNSSLTAPLDSTTSTTPSTAVKKPGYTIEIEPSVSLKDIAPSLDRGIHFNASIPVDVQTILNRQYAEVTGRLKTDLSRADDWLDMGVIYHSANDFEGARDIWLFLVQVISAPESAVVYDNLGKLYKFDIKDFAKSEEYFKKSIQIDSTSITPYIELFELYREPYKANTSAAADILITASKKFPTNPDPFVLLGLYYRDQQDVAKARSYLEKGRDLAKAAGDTNRVKTIQDEIDHLPQ
ncbi:MAG: hypothetical protein V4449_00105 [Patescibacteria group bacterium]